MKKVTVLFLSLAMILTMMPASAFASSTARASNVKYYTDEDNVHTGIKSFDYLDDEGNTRNYIDVSNNETTKLDEATIKKVLTTDLNGKGSLLSQWGNLASAIFGSGSGTGEEEYCYVGQNSYYDDFKPGTAVSGHRVDVRKALQTVEASGANDLGNSCYRATGLKNASSLNQVREEAGQLFSDVIGKRTATRDKALDRKDLDEALPNLKDNNDTQAFYSIVASMQEPSSCKRKINVYGICFYDFQISPIADDNLEVVNAATGYDSIEDASKDSSTGVEYSIETQSSTFSQDNNSEKENTYDVATANSHTESLSDTSSKSYTYDKSNEIGNEVSIEVGRDADMVRGSETFSYGYTWGEAWESTTESGVQKDDNNEASQTSSILMPAHTSVKVTHNTTIASYSLPYNAPVEVTYKVVVFNMSGDIYADNVAVYNNNTSQYKTSDATFFFGSGKSGEAGFVSAAEDLELRWDNYNKGVSGYDDAHADCYRYYHYGTSETKTSKKGLDWKKVSKESCNGNITSAIDSLCLVRPTLTKGAVISRKCEIHSSTIGDYESLYPIKEVVVEDEAHANGYNLLAGTGMNLPNSKVVGKNTEGAEYYGFSQSDGHWEIVDGEDVVSLNYDYASTGRKPTVVKGKKVGTATLRWVFDDPELVYESVAENGDVRVGDINELPEIMINVVNCKNITTAAVKSEDDALTDENKAELASAEDQVSVLAEESSDENVVTNIRVKASGKTAVASDEPVFIGDLVDVTGTLNGKTIPISIAFDVSKKPSTPVDKDESDYDDAEWESSVDEAGMANFTGPGTYTFTTEVNGQKYSADIKVGEEREIESAEFSKNTISINGGTTLNISSFLTFKDQYGKEWTISEWKKAKGTSDLKLKFRIIGPTKTVEITKQSVAAYLNDDNGAYITPKFVPGNYTVEVYRYGEKLDSVKVKATQLPGTKVNKLRSGKNSLRVTLTEQKNKVNSKHIAGYQIRYSTDADMSNAKIIDIKGYKNTSATIKNLKARKKYYIKARSYVNYKGITIYSRWSAAKSLKTR